MFKIIYPYCKLVKNIKLDLSDDLSIKLAHHLSQIRS